MCCIKLLDFIGSSLAGRRFIQLQKQAEQLQEDLYRTETSSFNNFQFELIMNLSYYCLILFVL
jgi:hypothetical protein